MLKKEDNPEKDVRGILDKSTTTAGIVLVEVLIENLIVYLVNRDHKVFDDAYEKGKNAGKLSTK